MRPVDIEGLQALQGLLETLQGRQLLVLQPGTSTRLVEAKGTAAEEEGREPDLHNRPPPLAIGQCPPHQLDQRPAVHPKEDRRLEKGPLLHQPRLGRHAIRSSVFSSGPLAQLSAEV